MKKIDWKAEFKKLTTTKGSDPLKMEITPFRDWQVLVIVSSVALLASFGYNLYVSIEINRDSFFNAAPKSTGVIKFNEDGLAKVIVGIDEKAARFEKIKTEGVDVVDPSL